MLFRSSFTVTVTSAGPSVWDNVTIYGLTQYLYNGRFCMTAGCDTKIGTPFTAAAPPNIGTIWPGTSITFWVGGQLGATPTGTASSATVNITASLAATSGPNRLVDTSAAAVTVTQEDVQSTYTGDMMVFIGAKATSATVTLRATIVDPTAFAAGDPRWDAFPGNVSTARVTFTMSNGTEIGRAHV